MANRQKRITLSWPHPNCNPRATEEDLKREPYYYRIEKVVNSVDYHPLRFLSPIEAKDLVDLGTFEVIIVPKQIEQ